MPVPLTTVDQFLGFAISLLSVRITNKAFMSDPRVLLGLKIALGVSIVGQVLIALYIKRQIASKGDSTVFKYKTEPTLFNSAGEEEIETTVQEYDAKEADKMLRGCMLQGAVIVFAFYKWGMVQLTIMQSTTLVRNLIFNSLYRAHLFGRKILRPYSRNLLFGSAEEAVAETAAERKKKKEE